MNTEQEGFTVTSQQAAIALGVSVSVLRKYSDIPFRQYLPRGRRWYRQSDIDLFLEKHTYNLREVS